MRKIRAFTMVEVMMASVLTVVVVGSLSYVFHFATRTAANVAASVTASFEAQQLSNELTKIIRNSVSCAVVTSGGNTGLRCTMPASGTDSDMDGYADTYTPVGNSKRGIEKYGIGKRVWFYMATTSAQFVNPGHIVWRAQKSDDSLPIAADRDASFPYYLGTTNPRWDAVESITFSVDPVNRTTTFRIVCSQLSRAQRNAADEDIAAGAGFRTTLTRTVFWGNWRS